MFRVTLALKMLVGELNWCYSKLKAVEVEINVQSLKDILANWIFN